MLAEQRRLAPIVAHLIHPYLLTEAPVEEDQQRNTDFWTGMVLLARPQRIACRIREHEALWKWPDDFTVRSYVRGQQTEIHKIAAGWGDLMFYGIKDEAGDGFAAWTLIDLAKFRMWLHVRLVAAARGEPLPYQEQMNRDGTRFWAFNIPSLWPPAVVARLTPPPASGLMQVG